MGLREMDLGGDTVQGAICEILEIERTSKESAFLNLFWMMGPPDPFILRVEYMAKTKESMFK